MTSLAVRLFTRWWALDGVTQVLVLLLIAGAWSLCAAWYRAGDSLKRSAERRAVER